MFTDLHWLILLIPVLWFIFRVPAVSRKLLVLRVAIALLLILALAGLQLHLPSREGMIVVVADRSLSMPADADSRIAETMTLLKRQMPESSRLGLVSFADEVKVEMAPSRASFSGFSGEINQDASNLNEGLLRALTLIPIETSARIVVMSDGHFSGKPPESAAFKAAARGIPIDYRLLTRDGAADLAINSLVVPGLVSPGESFVIAAEVFSPIEQQAEIVLRSSGKVISNFSRILRLGRNSLAFSHSIDHACVSQYELSVKVAGKDPIPENNQALAITEVVGKKPILVVSDGSQSSLADLLKRSGHEVELMNPGQISWSVEFLAGYSAVILENVSANRVTQHGMKVLSAWVQHLGGGLLMTGGKNSYGTGGYYQSALEAALPVSLELRSEHRKLALALMIVLDRSGSMAAPARGDRTKMDLANIAAAGSLDLLSPLDEFGLLAVDTEPHVVVPMQTLNDKGLWREKILRVESMGGGIYVFEGLSKAAEILLQAKAQTRHIILFADASDSEQPGRYWELLEKAGKAGITVSVIGLGTDADCDANILRKVAEAGKGRIFFTRDPEELPRLFSQDTFVAARSTFIDEPVAVETLPAVDMFIDEKVVLKSSIGAYNLCYLKPEAFMAARIADDTAAPLISAWQFGLGRVACYAGVIDGQNAGEFLRQPAAADILSGVCGWISTDLRQTLDGMPVTQQLEKGRWRATLHLDPERERELFRDVPAVTVMRSFANQMPDQETIPMFWETADSLVAEVPLHGNEKIVAMVSSGKHRARLYPVCQPYSHEFVPQPADAGSKKLRELAEISGGRELIDLSQSWDSMPATVQFRNLADWLLLMALLLFIVEIAERRMALLTIFLNRLRRQKMAVAEKNQMAVKRNPLEKSIKTTEHIPAVVSQVVDPEAAEVKTEPEAGFSAALKHAKKQADKINR